MYPENIAQSSVAAPYQQSRTVRQTALPLNSLHLGGQLQRFVMFSRARGYASPFAQSSHLAIATQVVDNVAISAIESCVRALVLCDGNTDYREARLRVFDAAEIRGQPADVGGIYVELRRRN